MYESKVFKFGSLHFYEILNSTDIARIFPANQM